MNINQEVPSKRFRTHNFLKFLIRKPFILFIRIYVFMFGRPSTQFFNDAILLLALRARGFGNCCGIHATGEINFIKLLAKHEPKLCIDIGANKGEYSLKLLEETNSNVIAFEPLPSAFSQLTKLKEEYSTRFEAYSCGIGSKKEKMALYFGKDDELGSFSTEVNQIDFIGNNNVNSLEVDVITLDHFYEKNLQEQYSSLDLLKIDTEGFEMEVLLGAQKTIKALRPKFIQIEFNIHQLYLSHSLLKLSELMQGYKAYQLLPHGTSLIYRDVKKPESNIYIYSNFVFVREDIMI